MKLNLPITILVLAWSAAVNQVVAQGTAFTYQGQLQNTGTPANGLYDFQFKLFGDPLGATPQVGSSSLAGGVPVTNGLFTTTVNFGADIFTGSNYWLEVDVRTNDPANLLGYSQLSPKQPLTPTPYAIFAANASNVLGPVSSASVAGTYANTVNLTSASNTLNGTFTGNGTGITNVNAVALNGLTAASFWQLGGNAGTTPGVNYVGTSDNQPLELHVNGIRGLRLEFGGISTYTGGTVPNGAPNVIGGAPINFVTPGVVGAFIGGGGATNYLETSLSISNSIGANSDFSVIGGGLGSTIGTNSGESTIGGGFSNLVQYLSLNSFIGGGALNLIGTYSSSSTIDGGLENQIGTESYGSTIGGGFENQVSAAAPQSTIAGGYENQIFGDQYNNGSSFIGGGATNRILANANYSTIAGGYENQIFGDQLDGGGSVIGGGSYNEILTNANFSTIAGGYENQIYGDTEDNGSSFIGGGFFNRIQTNSDYSTIGGGEFNQVSNAWGTVPGGYKNIADGEYSFAAGQQAQALHPGAFVWADSEAATFSSTTNDEFSIRAQNGVRIQSNVGIHLDAADQPLIVRDWNPFTPNAPADKVGIGRWGLFMEPHIITIGFPSNDIPGSYFQVAKYSTNGTATALLQVDQSGNVIAKGSITASGVLVTSDRNAKENFSAVDSRAVLAKVASLPMEQWNYKTDAPGVQHLGPMAQDFHAAFQLDGVDDKHISVVDEGGVALAAIQGLNQKLNEKDAEIQTLREQNDSLAKRLDELETAIKQLGAIK